MRSIFMMGFDTWADGQDEESYIESCLKSPKYPKGKWYVLEDQGVLVSTLITYPLLPHPECPAIGIGSIATHPTHRKRGHAAQLIREVINETEGNSPVRTFFLYSDIDPAYYEQFGFVALPPQLQPKKTSVCMIKCQADRLQTLLEAPEFLVPGYF